jgi:DNA-binding NtrC family response regulator
LAATNRDLEHEVEEKRFRQDLYYRLSAFVIRVPPLRDRREDIPLLVAAFLRNACSRARKEIALAPGTIATLQLHAWPGNVRELENTIERLVIGARTGVVDKQDVLELLRSPQGPRSDSPFADLPTLELLEQRYMKHVLELAKGNRTRSAEILGIDRRTLYRKAARYGFPLAGPEDEEDVGSRS